MNYVNKQIVVNANANTTFTSAPILLDDVYMFSFQSIFTGSPTGSLVVQVSNDATKFPEQAPTNWTNLQTATAISAAGSNIIERVGAPYGWARIVYTFTSGTGTLSISYVAKG